MQGALKRFADEDALGKLALKVDELTNKFPVQVDELSAADAGWKQFFDHMKSYAEDVPAVLNKMDPAQIVAKLLEVQKQLDDSNAKLEMSFTKAWAAYEAGASKARDAGIQITGTMEDLSHSTVMLGDVLKRELPAPIYEAY